MKFVLFSFLVFTIGCGSRSVLATDADGGLQSDRSSAGSMVPDTIAMDQTLEEEFCSGAAKAELNGSRLDVLQVTGEVVAMGCCDGAAVRFVVLPADPVSSKAMVLVAGIRTYGGAPYPTLPTNLDLARLPDGWELGVHHYPSSPAGECFSEQMTISSINQDLFQGSVELNGTSFYDGSMRVTLCLRAESGPNPNDTLQSVRLYAREVLIPAP